MLPLGQAAHKAEGGTNLGREDTAELLALGNGGPLLTSEVTPVHILVAQFAATRPTDTAVTCGGTDVSYAALDAWAGRIACRVATAGLGRGSRIAVVAQPSAGSVAAVLAILRLGAAYVPVDPALPERRLAEVLADADVTAVLTACGGADQLTGLRVPVVRAGDSLDGADPATDHWLDNAEVSTDDPAYIIYTSGSTGAPKGILVEHGQLAASTLARSRVYQGAAVFLLISNLAYDSSAAGLWGTLTTGGRLVVATSDELNDPELLIGLIERTRVQRMLCVPSLYSVLLDAAKRSGVRRLRSLETVITAGEPLPDELMERHFALHQGGVALVNEYGPSEATIWATYRHFDTPGVVSIGRPIPGTRLYVLDDELRLVPKGVTGELYIGGPMVARGYVGRPEETARAFISDPFAGIDRARLYRTGDLVKWSDEGTLVFLGRRDHQVKIRGYRVELGAVEAALRAVPGVRDAVVLTNESKTLLTGFVLAQAQITPQSVREHMAERLSAVMVPSKIFVLDSFPLTASGKVDREQLRRAVCDEGQAQARTGAPPAGPGDLSSRIAAAWAEVLKVPEVSGEVNFFEAGGYSLAMFQLQDAIERHTGYRPSVVDLFRHTTVAAQAALIEGGETGLDARLASVGRATPARRLNVARANRLRELGEAAP